MISPNATNLTGNNTLSDASEQVGKYKGRLPARLILETGESYAGWAPNWAKEVTFGEVVFTTGMMGYVESLTDPSFAGQILVFTYPLIGNYGVPDAKTWESSKIQVQGVIVSELSTYCHHHASQRTLEEWLRQEQIPFLFGIDTRALTKSLRSKGAALGAIAKGENIPHPFENPNQTHLVAAVSTPVVQESRKGKKKIIAVDCGMKENIFRSLLRFPMHIKRVPHDYDYAEEEFDGIFLSNGPGDPVVCKDTIEVLRKALRRKKPVFGICLGAQMLALAIGAKTYKLPYGHRGQNQPCEHIGTTRCYLTSQNHGYAIDEETLPKDWEVTFRNLNDASVEGIAHKELPFFAVQFHPEAAPGPIDTLWLFEQFYHSL
jgi:carbamoyl-phosphate synthase small subunit